MFKDNHPRYWVPWYDRWHLLLLLVLLLLLCLVSYYALTTPPPQVTLGAPVGALQADRPIVLKGQAPADSVVRLYDGDNLLGETRADSQGNYAFTATNLGAGAHSLRAAAEVNGARIESPALAVTVAAAVAAVRPTAPPTIAPPATTTPAPPTATAVPTTATSAPPPATPTLAAGAVQRRGKDNAEMVYVPAGEFAMGDPTRTVYLDPFWMDKTEVTNEQFQQFVDATGFKSDAEKLGFGYEFSNGKWDTLAGIYWRAPRGAGSTIADKLKQPVVVATWSDATAYCTWAGKRLPTDAEWEKTARGTDGRVYPWGNTWDGTKLNFCDSNCAFTWKDASANDGNAENAPVGSYAQGASPFGALDMAGNVWEWAADWYDPSYYAAVPTRNPTGPANGQFRVLRGGAWSIDASYARTTARFYAPPDFRQRSLGLRCAQSP